MIRIGTLAGQEEKTVEYISKIVGLGFEAFQLNFWQSFPDGLDLSEMAGELAPLLSEHDAVVSSLSVFGNPLGEEEIDERTRQDFRRAIEYAGVFGCELVTGFAGRVKGRSVPDSIQRYKEVFSPLNDLAGENGVKIAFENCPMGGDWSSGDWNIAYCPDAWELMFEALPSDHIGLEWEPCHQICQLVDPIAQLRTWASKVFHVHGKDATLHQDVLRQRGILSPEPFAHHRHPGFGDSNWSDIISILRKSGYQGTIDIEGWHDPVYCGDLELTGQLHALRYLKNARGGDFVAVPNGFVR